MSTKLDIGAGLNPKKPLDEWTHFDMNPGPHIEYTGDFGNLPFDDNTVAEIWLGDVIEHIPPWRHAEVMGEFWRVLMPSGILGGATPSLLKSVDQYVTHELPLDEVLVPRLYGWADRITEFHYHTFTKESLNAWLSRTGFDQLDLSSSPGPAEFPWWFIFSCIKGGKTSYSHSKKRGSKPSGRGIEQVPQWELKDFFAKMQVGETLKSTTPDPGLAMQAYHTGKIPLDELLSALYGDGTPESQHYMTYYPDALEHMLAKNGFGFNVNKIDGYNISYTSLKIKNI